MNNIKVIILTGFAKSGKDTSCDYLAQKYGYKRIAFADMLKEMVAEQYKIPLEYLHKQEYKEMPLEQYPVIPKDQFSLLMAKTFFKEFRTMDREIPDDFVVDPSGTFLGIVKGQPKQLYNTPRSLAILEGSVKRSVDPSYWVSIAIDKIYKQSNEFTDNKFVITDGRYVSELKQLKGLFGKNLKTIRINRFDTTESTDSSELDLIGFKHDYDVDNKSTLDNLYKQLDNICEI